MNVIGAGASSLSFLNSLIQIINPDKYLNIIVIEKNGDYGCGNAYRNDVISNLLNTKAGLITIDNDKKEDFFNWLKLNENIWKEDYPELKIHKDAFVPRSLFGDYLQERFNKLIINTLKTSIKITTIKAEVINIKKIGKDDSLLIIGARLSAIDTIIALKENGHKGLITLFSRSRTFPCVRGNQKVYKNNYLCKNYIEKNNIVIDIEHLIELFQKEIRNYLKENKNVELAREEFSIYTGVVHDFKNYLLEELSRADKLRPWQAILYDTNTIVSYIWNSMPEIERELFMTKYMSYATSVRISIPPENARKLVSYIERNELEYTFGSCNIISVKENNILCYIRDQKRVFDKIIYATGSPRDLTLADTKLYKNLFKSKIIKKNKYGGITVNEPTHEVISGFGYRNEGFFALGEITNGTYLFTSALDIIVRHSNICSQLVAQKLL